MTHWPQFTLVALQVLGLGIVLASHGRSRGTHNIFFSLLDNGVLFWLLWAGGFFSGAFS